MSTRLFISMQATGQRALQAVSRRCRCECLLPNLFVGTLTRQSVNDALKAGLTAEGIVSYLVLHAHPRVAHRAPVVPEASATSFSPSGRALMLLMHRVKSR